MDYNDVVIFIGDKPSPRMAKGAKPFEGAKCEARLLYWICQILGGYAEENEDYKIINQCDYTYDELTTMFKDSHMIALGNNASKALKDLPHYKLPHPSGKNRLLNDKKFVKQKLKECKEYIADNNS